MQLDFVVNANPASAIGRHQYGKGGPFPRQYFKQCLHDWQVSLPGSRMRMCRKASGHRAGDLELDVTDAQVATYPTLFLPRV